MKATRSSSLHQFKMFKCIPRQIEFGFQCHKAASGNQIMQVVWTHVGELFLITKMGLEFLKVSSSKPFVKLVRTLPIDVTWFVYSHESRLLIVGTTPMGNVLHPFHFPPESVIKLPKFELAIDPDSYVQSNEISICQIYEVLYCIHIDPDSSRLMLYQIGRDDIRLRRTYNLPVGMEFACSVIDNVLVVHATDAKVSMLFDLKMTPDIPISLPSVAVYLLSEKALTKARAQSVSSPASSDGVPIPQPLSSSSTGSNITPPSSPTMSAHSPPSYPTSPMGSPQIYSGNGLFYLPNILFDPEMGMLFDVRINYGELSKDVNDSSRMAWFLMRRTNSKSHVIKLIRSCIEKRQSLPDISGVFEAVNKVYRSYLMDKFRESTLRQAKQQSMPKHEKRFSIGSNTASIAFEEYLTTETIIEATDQMMPSFDDPLSMDEITRPTAKIVRLDSSDMMAIIDQDDFYKHVFCPIGDSKSCDFKYLLGVCMEYVRSLLNNGLKVQHFIYHFIIDLLVKNKAYYQLHQFLQYHVISDSLPVACQLLSLDTEYRPAYQLALDMFKRLSESETIMETLLSHKQVIPAIRMARTHQEINISCRRLLEVASSLKNPLVFHTTYKWLQQRNEVLRGSPAFTPEDDCDEFEALFTQLFPSARTPQQSPSL
eukprot:TRINITY_DN2732_c0_g1_i8.p1 TRINITY_DN2732_c0_g1~~TRINITY_DN2732_c0_g1_i8.p1  ORF type:complete len:654 (+),score=72.38 TRINITY_DN2732_c0_g1_i8:52-2013(+)